MPEQRALLWSVVHELRAPLSALTIAADLIATDTSSLDPETLGRLADSIQGGARWLQETMESLLSPAAIESGLLCIERAPTFLDDVVQDVLPIIGPLLSARQQRLQLRRRGRAGAVLADRKRIGQVIINLVSNASKYGPPSMPIDLTIDACESGSVRVVVADRGPGLTRLMQQRMFAPHFRSAGARLSGAEGMGLGLAIVKSIIAAHGGQVGVRNRAGGGARFWFDLPQHSDVPVSIRSRRDVRRRSIG